MDSQTSGGETPSSRTRRDAATPKVAGAKRSSSSKAPASKGTAAKSVPKRRAAATSSTPATGRAGAKTRRRTPSGDERAPVRDGTVAGGPPWPDRAGPWRGRLRNPDLYNRRAQRTNEQWPITARLLAAPLGHPQALLRLLGVTEPVERDGRVLNPAIQAMLSLGTRLGAITSSSTPADMPTPFLLRRRLRNSARAVMPVRTDVYVSGRVIPGPDDAPRIGIRVYRQFGAGLGMGMGRSRPLPAIVYFHGGGFVTGDLDSHDALCRMVAAASRCLVVAVDYRLAPEYPFPAAVDDALTAYAWVHDHGEELGIDPGRIGVMGDSAGGNLAAVVAQVTRAGTGPTDVPPPVAQGLVYPVVDTRFGFESMQTLGEGFLLTRVDMEYFRDHYLPDRSDWENPLASPLLAEDLAGLAPALVVTAGFDPLRDDAVHYAEALRQAGVAVEERRYDDQIHGFMSMGIVPDSLAVATEVCESMGRLMRRSAPGDDTGAGAPPRSAASPVG